MSQSEHCRPLNDWPEETDWKAVPRKRLNKIQISTVDIVKLGIVVCLIVTIQPRFAWLAIPVGLIFGFILLTKSIWSKSDESFQPEPEEIEGVHPVTLEIFLNQIPIGKDSGILGIDDGLVFFTGSTSSFALGVQDIKVYLPMITFYRPPTFDIRYPGKNSA